MNDPTGGVAKVTCPTFEAMGQIRTRVPQNVFLGLHLKLAADRFKCASARVSYAYNL